MDILYKTKKILIIDDDKLQLSYMEEILSEVFSVISAESGKIALEMLINGYMPDLILLDILMPEMDGFEVFRKIRAENNLKNIPIIFVTSVNEENEIRFANKIGASDYIIKPFKKSVLINRIKNVININDYLKSVKNKNGD